MQESNDRSEAQKRAEKNYYNRNKDKRKKQSEKASTRRYINKSNLEELNEIKVWIKKRVLELKGWFDMTCTPEVKVIN